jgi:hypothetical protein
VDRKKVRVTGPFTVEAVPAPAVKPVDEILEPKPEPADTSIARSDETLRQAEWRDELLRTGIRGKNGGTELEFVIMVIAVSCVKLLSAHNSTQHTSRKHKV